MPPVELSRAFDPKFMKIGVLTAALQELTPRDARDADPDRAIEDWIQFAHELGVETIQLSAAFHPADADVPAAAMLDPVAGSIAFIRRIDEAAACMYALQHDVLPAQDIPTQGTGREPYRS